MAQVVLGIGTSHTPMLSLPPELWPAYAERDKHNPELLAPPGGKLVSYDELLAKADPSLAKRTAPETFRAQYDECQRALAQLERALAGVAPDVVVVIGDDQEELFFEDNMPAISIYWGESLLNVPRQGGSPAAQAAMWGYGKEERSYRVDSTLGKHLIEYLTEAEFDVAHSRYLREEYGGQIGPCSYMPAARVTQRKRQGMPHAYGFVVQRIMNEKIVQLVPVTLNTCYPPNQPTARRCYALGRALRDAIEAWDSDKRVGVIASGGLSHFVLDEELDRMALRAFENGDGEAMAALPAARMNGAASEIKNWIAMAGASGHLAMELLAYVPVCRTPAGTGGGWAFARWQ